MFQPSTSSGNPAAEVAAEVATRVTAYTVTLDGLTVHVRETPAHRLHGQPAWHVAAPDGYDVNPATLAWRASSDDARQAALALLPLLARHHALRHALSDLDREIRALREQPSPDSDSDPDCEPPPDAAAAVRP